MMFLKIKNNDINICIRFLFCFRKRGVYLNLIISNVNDQFLLLFYYSIDFKDFALDLLNVVDDQEMDFHEDTPVVRPPATSLSGHVF